MENKPNISDCALLSELRPNLKRTLYKVKHPFDGRCLTKIYEGANGALWCVTYDLPPKEILTDTSYLVHRYCRKYDHETETGKHEILVGRAMYDRMLKTHAISLNR